MHQNQKQTHVSTNPKDALGRRKPSITDIPATALLHESMAMTQGREKYGAYNWRATTVSNKVYVDAMYRHLARYFDGETIDPESCAHHLGHVRACAGNILDAEENGTLVDDRPLSGKASEMIERLTKKQRLAPAPAPLGSEPSGTAAKRSRRVYIAGPMRGYPEFNFPAFDAARELALKRGFDPLSPADLDRASGVNEHTDPDITNTAKAAREFVERDIHALLSLRAEKGDAIALLPGWTDSTGASAEMCVARWLKLTVLDACTMRPFPRHEFIAGYTGMWNMGQGLISYIHDVQ